MPVSTTRMSSKGQVVIPGDIRKRLKLKEGANFVVLGERDTVVLKLVAPPNPQDIQSLLLDAQRQARQAGLTKSDVRKAIRDYRRGK
ncbi:MAG: AbrB/MazE/SpoVT family DNA-binding domain-containing protein [Deltaproteobacteria bacterium]|nr:AbrB/MazE/SpoVT family DNA-binding domain-containing protein [Deltaproteobacteria bacterium]